MLDVSLCCNNLKMDGWIDGRRRPSRRRPLATGSRIEICVVSQRFWGMFSSILGVLKRVGTIDFVNDVSCRWVS